MATDNMLVPYSLLSWRMYIYGSAAEDDPPPLTHLEDGPQTEGTKHCRLLNGHLLAGWRHGYGASSAPASP